MYKILFVDDERIIMEGIQSIIESFELEFNDFLIVEDGKYALEIIDQFKPDIIFTDVRMPYVSGMELIKQIRGRNDGLKDTPIVIVSGHSDFNYAKSAIGYGVFDYLLKPISKQELYDILVKITSYLKNKKNDKSESALDEKGIIFSKIIENEFKCKDDIESFINSLNINACEFEKLQLVEIVEVEEKNDTVRKQDEVEADILHIGNTFKQNLKKKDGVELVFLYEYARKAFILLGIRKNKTLINIDMSNISKKVLAEMQGSNKFDIYISSLFENITDIPAAYEQIKLVSRYKKLMPDKYVITFDEIRSKNREGTLFTKEIQCIVQGIEYGRLQQVMEQFNLIREYILANKELSVKYIENIYKSLFMEIYRHFYNLNSYKKYQEIFDRFANSTKLIDASNSFEEMHSNIRRVVLAFFDCYMQDMKNEGKFDNLIDMAKKAIEENYLDPVFSLQNTADKLHISSSYLSTIFKKSVGISFNEYLCKVRISKAIEFLKNDEISVSEIGKRIGYTSEKHFFSVFRKHTGLSPAKYRNKTYYNLG